LYGQSRKNHCFKGLLVAERLLHNIIEVGEILNVSRSTVYRLINNGELLVVNIGGCKRITKKAIHHFLEKQVRVAKLGSS
jgi:excisionase family DNA binding protein